MSLLKDSFSVEQQNEYQGISSQVNNKTKTNILVSISFHFPFKFHSLFYFWVISLLIVYLLIHVLSLFHSKCNLMCKNKGECSLALEIDRYIGLPIFFQIFKHFNRISV